jgi:hypothetical protein
MIYLVCSFEGAILLKVSCYVAYIFSHNGNISDNPR